MLSILKSIFHFLILGAILSFAFTATAKQNSAYTPDIAVFDGRSTYGFSIEPELSLDAPFTIEFWVSASWSEEIGYDPVMLTSGTSDDIQFVLAMLESRNGIVLIVDDQEWLVAHEFNNEKLHHLALIREGPDIDIVINGTLRDSRVFDLGMGKSKSVWLGSLLGEDLSFIGSIGQLRFWKDALTVETIRDFALSDLTDFETRHPNARNLHVFSDLNENALLMVDGISEIKGNNK